MSHGFSKEASRCRIEAARAIGFSHGLVASALPLDRARAERIECTNMGTVPVAALENVLRVEGFA
jgi:hypothetical protein